jgi:hypothetical protein
MSDSNKKYSIIQFVKNFKENEFFLIEIQGEIIHSIESNFNLMYLGKLINKDDKNYVFNIGNHQLIGKKIKLKNPILLCKKGIKNPNNNNNISILKIIEYKILFNTRPIPMLNENL